MVEANAVITSLQTAYDFTKMMIGIRDAALIEGKVGELRAQIFAALDLALTAKFAQAAQFERIRELEKEAAESKEWAAEREKYQLSEWESGNCWAFTYVLKQEHRAVTPVHHLCTNCYEDGRKSILQKESGGGDDAYLACPRCKTRIRIE